LIQTFVQQVREPGYLAMSGQVVNATLVPAAKQRNTEDQQAAIKVGKSDRQIWRNKPNKASLQTT
jgi:transposase, IS5 family